MASNSIAGTDIDIVQLGVVHSWCDGDRNGRWRLEGSLTAVETPLQSAYGGLIGIGYQFAVGERSSITPSLRVGYEDFELSDDQVVADVAVTLATSFPLDDGATAPLVTLEWVPEYTNRGSSIDQGLSFEDSIFTNYLASGLDMPLGDNFRGRVTASHRYIGGDNVVGSIVGLSFSFRPYTPDRCAGYCWNAELSLSRGDADYQSFLLGFSTRFGR
jgi:hypothetical protein